MPGKPRADKYFDPPRGALGKLYYAWVDADLHLGNTDIRSQGKFATLSDDCARRPARIRRELMRLSIDDTFPAGRAVPDHRDSKSRVMLASRVYARFLRTSVRNHPKYRVFDTTAKSRICRIVADLIAKSKSTGEWNWTYFEKRRTLGWDGLFWALDTSELAERLATLGYPANFTGAQTGAAVETFRCVGLPKYANVTRSTPQKEYDLAIRLDLCKLDVGVPDNVYDVPSIFDGRGRPYFMPGGDVVPDSGRTVYVPLSGNIPTDGIREWVHKPLALEDCLENMEVIGPVHRLEVPPYPTTAQAKHLLSLLGARVVASPRK